MACIHIELFCLTKSFLLISILFSFDQKIHWINFRLAWVQHWSNIRSRNFLFHSLSVNLLILEALIECNICKNFFILISNSHMATFCNLFLISNVDHHDRGWLFQQTFYFDGERSYFKRLDIQILQIEIWDDTECAIRSNPLCKRD